MSSSPAGLAAGQLAALRRSGPSSQGMAPHGLLEALPQVPDPRDPRGVRYRLAAVLAVAVCATLAWARSYAAIAGRCRAAAGAGAGAALSRTL
jgi:hypothetical protein